MPHVFSYYILKQEPNPLLPRTLLISLCSFSTCRRDELLVRDVFSWLSDKVLDKAKDGIPRFAMG